MNHYTSSSRMSFPITRSVSGKGSRIASIDQFRGYAILTMIFVNFVGRFDITPWMLKHHKLGMSFNDTIAPIFVFVVGMGFRLSLQRRIQRDGSATARRAAVKRFAILAGLGFVAYFGYFWDALTYIGIGGLLALPFMDKGPRVRILAAAAYLGLYQCLFSLAGYGDWVLAHSINGGPLGPLSWVFMLLLGSVAYDLMASGDSRRILVGCLAWGVGLSAAGWLLRAEWRGVKAGWPFTQYGMSAPYAVYSTGLAFLTLLPFHILSDKARIQLPHLTVLGENPLVMYATHGILIALGTLCLSDRAPLSAVAIGFLCVCGLCYALARWLHAKGIIVKV